MQIRKRTMGPSHPFVCPHIRPQEPLSRFESLKGYRFFSYRLMSSIPALVYLFFTYQLNFCGWHCRVFCFSQTALQTKNIKNCLLQVILILIDFLFSYCFYHFSAHGFDPCLRLRFFAYQVLPFVGSSCVWWCAPTPGARSRLLK